MSAAAAIYNAVVPDYSAYLRPGEQRFIVAVAVRQKQAQEFIRTCRELLRDAPDPDLRALVDESQSTSDEITFKTGVTIRAMPCSSRSTRGLAISLLVMDEAAHMSTTEDGFAAGAEVYHALLYSTVQFGKQGYVIVASTPMWCDGIFWDLYQQGMTGTDIFVAQKPTWEMNPNITRESLEDEFRADPDRANVEVGAQFLEGAGAYLTAVSIKDCIAKDRKALPVAQDVRYWAACDPAFAAGGDAFTFAIGHRLGTGGGAPCVVDRLVSWKGKRSPLNSDSVLDEIADLAREYKLDEVISDQYAIVPLSDGLRRRGVNLKAQPLTNELKADIFGALKRAVNTARIELLDDPLLVAELQHLQVRPTPSGKPRIAAAPGFHDDLAMVVATLCHAMKGKRERAVIDMLGAANSGFVGGGFGHRLGDSEHTALMRNANIDNDETMRRASERIDRNLLL